MSQIEHLETPVTIAPMTEAANYCVVGGGSSTCELASFHCRCSPFRCASHPCQHRARLMLALMAGLVWLGKLPPELTMMIPLLALGAYVCAEIGKSIPIFAISEAPRSSRPSCHSTWSTRIFQSRGPRSPQ
jgi:hypothetical protein